MRMHSLERIISDLYVIFQREFRCICSPDYTERNLEDPNCWYHDIESFLDEDVVPIIKRLRKCV